MLIGWFSRNAPAIKGVVTKVAKLMPTSWFSNTERTEQEKRYSQRYIVYSTCKVTEFFRHLFSLAWQFSVYQWITLYFESELFLDDERGYVYWRMPKSSEIEAANGSSSYTVFWRPNLQFRVTSSNHSSTVPSATEEPEQTAWIEGYMIPVDIRLILPPQRYSPASEMVKVSTDCFGKIWFTVSTPFISVRRNPPLRNETINYALFIDTFSVVLLQISICPTYDMFSWANEKLSTLLSLRVQFLRTATRQSEKRNPGFFMRSVDTPKDMFSSALKLCSRQAFW